MRLYDGMPAAMIAVACTVGTIALATRDRPRAAEVAPLPAPSAVLDGLRVGDRVAGWTVAAIVPTADGGTDVTMARDGQQFVLTVVPIGTRPENPPFSTPTHAIYYGHAQPPGAEIPAGALRAITADFLRRIARAGAPDAPSREKY